MKVSRIICVAVGVWLTALTTAGASRAQESFPDHPIRLVMPYSPGSVVDVFGRIGRPAFPAPSLRKGREIIANLGRMARRDRGLTS